MSADGADARWMRRALVLAAEGAAAGEVPVGAVLVRGEELLGEGFNQPIGACDPSAHAEMLALRAAAKTAGNYRLPGSTLYVTMEPCPMCAGAIVHARLARVVFGARDAKWGGCGSVLQVLEPGRFNHDVALQGGLLADESAALLGAFFRARRGSAVAGG